MGALLDLVVFAAVTAVAFNGYESGKSFFVVPAVAALTLRDVPLVRRVVWLACALAVAWIVRSLAPGTMNTALAAVPHEPLAFAAGIARLLHAYFVDWYIDFPALLVAALQARSDRYVAEIVDELRGVCVASRINKPIGDKMIMNAAFLISRDQEAQFDARVKEVATRQEELTFKYTGPWPPYNFVNIRLKLERA